MNDREEHNRHSSGAGRNSPASAPRRIEAASVTQPWWQAHQAGESPEGQASPSPKAAGSSSNPITPMAPPPPPPPPAAGWSAAAAPMAAIPSDTGRTERDAARIERLEQELAAARDETTALHEMLEDLPEIFERKFRQRLHGILEQQQLLLADNRLLRDQLFALQPAAPEAEERPTRLLPPASAPANRSTDTGNRDMANTDIGSGGTGSLQPLQRLVRGMRRLGRRLRSGRREPHGRREGSADDSLSDRDDGMPRAA